MILGPAANLGTADMPHGGKILARAYASLGRSKILLQEGLPSSFLGDQHCEQFTLADEIERTPKVGHVILTDKQVRDLTQQFFEQRIVPPLRHQHEAKREDH
jgi:hypothetical protein